MGFLNADFILVASKLVFTKVLWRFENVPQIKFKYFQGPKWMNEEEFQEFSKQDFSNILHAFPVGVFAVYTPYMERSLYCVVKV